MKKILPIFLIFLFLSGCQTKIEKIIKHTVIVKENKTVFVELQKEEAPPIDEMVSKPSIVGDGNLIVIDAGHQRHGNNGKEPIGPGATKYKAKVTSGATGIKTGNLESEINLQVALKLQKQLEANGYTVMMVRTSQDVNISNQERARIANENGAAAFIRLHCNSNDSTNVRGALTIAPSNRNPYCSQIAVASQELSTAVLNNMCNETGLRNRGLMINDEMSGINWCQVPVTIVEMGFISNPEEDILLSDDAYQNKIVQGIVKGINQFLKK